eukprot:scaffold169220_cov58-Attheya_sp.AAC.2
MQADLDDTLKEAKPTPDMLCISTFPHFSTSYGGISSPVPVNMTADTYYHDVTPSDHNIQGPDLSLRPDLDQNRHYSPSRIDR